MRRSRAATVCAVPQHRLAEHRDGRASGNELSILVSVTINAPTHSTAATTASGRIRSAKCPESGAPAAAPKIAPRAAWSRWPRALHRVLGVDFR
ncbi:hypothetical protein [Nocardia sp. SC052]|uniref:hypothetical protein n=1 Tax=Nocardia sichangensis TaxID=3385975 RepID=UPI0039A12E15